MEERGWAFYEGADGSAPVNKELEKAGLARYELTKLAVLMDRVKARQTLPGDVKNVGHDLLEVRLTGNRRIFRLLYAEETDGLVLLALSFFQKTSRKAPPNELDTAERRLKEWRNRRPKE
ncbi:type II toxin-antitoxin system RelE/ParE family toxin [Kitasatospora sp. NPDC088351]|uniref:type II toxin-antitoxin system RelE/ParE family toxin n=1 Tax=unclassified Kitasatospora TaxID=2633591 RepID=UPI003441FBE5